MRDENQLNNQTLRGLRVGDKVRIHLRHASSAPFEVVLTRIHHGANFDERGSDRPIVEWKPRPDVDFHPNHKHPFNFCDSAYVVEIVSRAPYKTPAIKKNSLVMKPGHRSFVENLPKKGKYIASSPYELAFYLLGKDHNLNIPYGLNEDRLYAEWEKASNPGLKGVYSYENGGKVTPIGHRFRSTSGLDSLWIDTKKFKSWLIRRLPHLIVTKAEARERVLMNMAISVECEDAFEFS